jgi:hypothetical protein
MRWRKRAYTPPGGEGRTADPVNPIVDDGNAGKESLPLVSRVRFDFPALYGALDAERRRRGLSWQQVAREVGPAVSTLTRTALGGPMDADGVLAMTRWLGRTFESFMAGQVSTAPRTSAAVVPPPDSADTRRFDARAIYTALDQRRRSLAMSWTDVASEIGGCTPAMLTWLAKGGRMDVRLVVTVSAWLGRTAESFTHALHPRRRAVRGRLTVGGEAAPKSDMLRLLRRTATRAAATGRAGQPASLGERPA